MARRTKKAPPVEEPPAPPKVLDANQVVAYNFRAARELRGWTQEETARRLAPYIGQVLPKASISGIERSFDGERKRFFDAQELVAFSLAFDLPVVWFLLPPPGADDYELAAAGRSVQVLATLLLGRDDQLDDIKERMQELRQADPESAGEVLAEAGGFPPELSWEHFQRSREEALFALVEEETSEIERLMGDLRRVVVRFDDLSQRSHYATHPRKVYQAISHSLIGEAVFDKVLQTFDAGRRQPVHAAAEPDSVSRGDRGCGRPRRSRDRAAAGRGVRPRRGTSAGTARQAEPVPSAVGRAMTVGDVTGTGCILVRCAR